MANKQLMWDAQQRLKFSNALSEEGIPKQQQLINQEKGYQNSSCMQSVVPSDTIYGANFAVVSYQRTPMEGSSMLHLGERVKEYK